MLKLRRRGSCTDLWISGGDSRATVLVRMLVVPQVQCIVNSRVNCRRHCHKCSVDVTDHTVMSLNGTPSSCVCTARRIVDRAVQIRNAKRRSIFIKRLGSETVPRLLRGHHPRLQLVHRICVNIAYATKIAIGWYRRDGHRTPRDDTAALVSTVTSQLDYMREVQVVTVSRYHHDKVMDLPIKMTRDSAISEMQGAGRKMPAQPPCSTISDLEPQHNPTMHKATRLTLDGTS
jgi:hypothetical protein